MYFNLPRAKMGFCLIAEGTFNSPINGQLTWSLIILFHIYWNLVNASIESKCHFKIFINVWDIEEAMRVKEMARRM